MWFCRCWAGLSFNTLDGIPQVTSDVFRHDWADSYIDMHNAVAYNRSWTSIEPSPSKLDESRKKELWDTHARAGVEDDYNAHAYMRIEIPTWLLQEYLGYTTFVRLEFSLRCDQKYAQDQDPYLELDVSKWLKDALVNTLQDYVSEDLRYYVFTVVGRWIAYTKLPELKITIHANSRYRHQIDAYFDGYVEVSVSSDLCQWDKWTGHGLFSGSDGRYYDEDVIPAWLFGHSPGVLC